MRYVVLFGLALVMAVAIAQQGPRPGRLFGRVEIAVPTPVQRLGQKPKVNPAVYKLYSIEVSQPGPHRGPLKSHARRHVATLKLSSTGEFSTELQAGEYVISLLCERPTMNALPSKTVTVLGGRTTEVSLRFDTGVR